MKDLSATSYAILGLLAIKPWTTYELAKQMERSLRNFWPRAESKLYEEPKNLVAHGLATARKERTGRRGRTVYTITPKGRRALRGWLDEPGDYLRLEFEEIVKVFFAEHGTKAQLQATLARIREETIADIELGEAFMEEYATTGGPFPERDHIIRLMTRFLNDISFATARWIDWAEREVASWDGVSGSDRPPPDPDHYRKMLAEGRRHVARLSKHRDQRTAREGVGGDR